MDFKMKTTAFKVFASCVAIVCLASLPVSRASPVLKSVSDSSESPIIKKHPCFRQPKHLVGQNVVDLKTYDSMLITNKVVQKPTMPVYEPMVSQKLHRQRWSYDPEVKKQLTKEQEGDNSSYEDSTDTDPVVQEPSSEFEDPQESNEVQTSEESNEIQTSEESNEVQDSPPKSNDVPDSEESIDVPDSEESIDVPNSEQPNNIPDSEQPNDDDDKLPRELPEPESYESEEVEVSPESGENKDDSTSTDDNKNESDKVITTTPYFERA